MLLIYHFIRDLVERKIVCLKYIPTERQNANIFIIPLDRSKFETLRQVIGVILCPWSVLFSWSLCFIVFPLWPLFFVPWFLCFSLLSLGVALHYIYAFHSRCFYLIYIYIKEKKGKRKHIVILALFSLFLKIRLVNLFSHDMFVVLCLALMSLFIILH